MRRALLTLFAALVLLSGCRRETPAPPPPVPQQTQATEPQSGGRLVRRIETDVSTLNYVLHTEEEERQVLAYLHDPLIALDKNLSPIPALAARWEIGDGGRSYTLHLDPRATFSDGTPVTASDVVFTLGKIIDEDSMQFASWFEGLDRTATKAIDERTVRVVFSEARAAQLLAFTIGVMPEHVYGKGDFAKNKQVVGTGPYVLRRREPGRSILVEKRADYWREKPYIDSVLFRVIADDTVAWNAMLRGDVDVGRVPNEIWAREKDKPAVRDKLEFHNAWLLSYNAVVWNVEHPLFNDPRVRRALAMSFDRQTVIDRLYHGQARAITGPFTPDQWAYDHEVLPIDFNPPAARALLASAGWSDRDGDGVLDRAGKRFAFTLLIPAGSVTSRDQSQVLQDALRGIGVQMEIAVLDGAAFFERVLGRNFEAAFMAWMLEPDPDPFAMFHSTEVAPAGLNVGGYRSEEADRLIEEARREGDRARRADLYHQLHEVLARDQPYLWTVQVASKWGVNRRVQNVQVSKGLGLFLWYPGPFAWWLTQS